MPKIPSPSRKVQLTSFLGFICLVVLFLNNSTAYALIYTLQPGLGPLQVIKTLRGQRVLRENIEYNSVPGELQVYLCPDDFSSVVQQLASILPQFKAGNFSKGGIILDLPREGGYERLLILQAGTHSKPVCFYLKLKRRPPHPGNLSWPAEIPQPGGAEIRHLIRFQRTGALYLAFHVPGGAAGSISLQMATQFQARGWQPVSRPDLNGAVFLESSGKRMLTLCVTGSPQATSAFGACYLRPLRK